MKTIHPCFELSQPDEHIIRSYQCTRLRKLFAPLTLGELTITNHRIVYHSQGTSLYGKSVLISEMPIQDAAAVSVYLGNSVNWILFAILAISTYLASTLYDAILPGFFTSWPFAALLMLPHALATVYSGNWLSAEAKERISNLFQRVERKLGRSVVLLGRRPWLRGLYYAGLCLLAWSFSHSHSLWYLYPVAAHTVLAIAYLGLYMLIIGRQKAFSLRIGSRAMQGTGISIPGSGFRLAALTDQTALQSLGGSPSVDALAVARELGALLTDIREFGELGERKWQS